MALLTKRIQAAIKGDPITPKKTNKRWKVGKTSRPRCSKKPISPKIAELAAKVKAMNLLG